MLIRLYQIRGALSRNVNSVTLKKKALVNKDVQVFCDPGHWKSNRVTTKACGEKRTIGQLIGVYIYVYTTDRLQIRYIVYAV